VQSGQICTISNSITFGDGVTIEIEGSVTITGASTLTVGSTATSTVRFQIKNGGSFSNETFGNITLYGSVQIDANGSWAGNGVTGNSIIFYGNFTNNSSQQTDNSTATYIFSNIGSYIFNAGIGMNVYNHTSSGLNTSFSGKWYVRNHLQTAAFKMNAGAEMYIYTSFTATSDWSHCSSSSILHYAGNMELEDIQYGCIIQIDENITTTLSSGNIYNNSDFIFDTNSSLIVTGTAYMHFLHAVTLNDGSTLYINNGNKPNNFDTYTNTYSPTSTFRFGNNGSNYSFLLYGDKQVFGNLVFDDASSSSNVYVFNGNQTIQGNLTVGSNIIYETWPGFTYNVAIAGNITNNGTINTGASGDINSFILNGTTEQVINGTNGITFYNLTVNNTSEEGIDVNQNIEIANLLTLTDGIMYTTASSYITILNGGTTTAGSDNSFVDGPIRKVGNTTFTFPTGDQNIWARIAYSPVSGFDATTVISAEYFFQEAPNQTDLDIGIHNVSKIEYWDISRISDPSNDATCNVTMYFNDMIRSVISGSGTDIITTHYESSLWKDKGGFFHDNFDNTGYITTTNALSDYSPITIASSDGTSPLPITLVSFNAHARNNYNEIFWATASEINNDFFTLYKSNDGITFIEIAKVNGKGNSNQMSNYNFNDECTNEITYYKLSQTDFDGTTEFFDIIVVENYEKKLDFIIFQDINNQITIKPNHLIQNGEFILYNSIGKSIEKIKVNNNYPNVFQTELSPGLYLICFSDKKNKLKKHFIKI